MKYSLIFLIFCCFEFVCVAQNPQKDPHWTSDICSDFSFFDGSVWRKEHFYREEGTFSEDIAFIDSSNIYINEYGKLVLTVNNDTTWHDGPCFYNDSGRHEYSSSSMISNSTYGFGYFEIYANLPIGTGLWPAFWLWNQNDNLWYQEIDIFEAFGYTDSVHVNVHWDLNDVKKGNDYQFQINYNTGYHWYGMEWDANCITWYLDRKIVRRIKNKHEDVSFTNPMYIIINLALTPHTYHFNPITNMTPFPSHMCVDSINVCHLTYDRNSIVTDILDFSNFQYSVRKSITLTGNTTIPTDSDITLRAIDYVELTNGFSFPLGSELYVDINDDTPSLSW